MTEAPEKNWVWRSTEESRAAGKVSVLAVFETLVCVALYWILLLWFGVTWHHWMILIATPLVLLRSEQSIALGVRWFDTYHRIDKPTYRPIKFISLILLSFFAAALANLYFAANWLAGLSGWELLLKSTLLLWLASNFGAAQAIAFSVLPFCQLYMQG